MFKLIKTAALSALIGIGALGAAPASAGSGVYLGLGGGHHGPSVGLFFGDSGGHGYRRHDYRRHDFRPRLCSPGQAVNKAERMGIRRAHVQNANRHVIRVAGRARGDRVVVSFGREPGCPVLGGRW